MLECPFLAAVALKYPELVLPENVNDSLDHKNVLSALHLNVRTIKNKGDDVVLLLIN